jgi:hypothetical protein
VLRSLEAQFPDIAFDWKAVIDNQQLVEPASDLRRPRKRRTADEERGTPAAAPVPAAAAQPPTDAGEPPPAARPPFPSTIEGSTPDEQIAFLTRWYPLVRLRIPQRTADPARQAALLALAERLNPTAWTDADQITTGLQQAAEALERLSRVFSKRRRRSRRASRTTAPAPEAVPAGNAAAPADSPAPDSPAPDVPSDTPSES